MKLIKPNLISGEIMTLFDEARSKVVIVCPYYRLRNWYKMKSKLASLKSRNIEVEFYVREDEYESISEVEALGYEPHEIPNLHCKLYMNEKTAIVSSMNLLLSSELYSLDIAYKTETKEEYSEVKHFYETYINKTLIDYEALIHSTSIDTQSRVIALLKDTLRSNHVKFKELKFNDNSLFVIANKENYRIYIKNGILEMVAVVALPLIGFAKSNTKYYNDKNVAVEFISTRNKEDNVIFGRLKHNLASVSITNVVEEEALIIYKSIIKFIYATDMLRGLMETIEDDSFINNPNLPYTTEDF